MNDHKHKMKFLKAIGGTYTPREYLFECRECHTFVYIPRPMFWKGVPWWASFIR